MAAKRSFSNVLSRQIGWGVVPPNATSFIRELPIVFGALGLFYSVIAFARYWASPVTAQAVVTASGGAWNASIVAEYFHFRGETISTTGLGAIISQATDAGNFRLLLAATVVMAMIVVSINRLLWRRLYSLAATRYKLEA